MNPTLQKGDVVLLRKIDFLPHYLQNVPKLTVEDLVADKEEETETDMDVDTKTMISIYGIEL